MGRIFDIFVATAESYGERPFLHIPASGAGAADTAQAARANEPIDYTYTQALGQIRTLKDLYREAGYGAGHRVGLMLGSSAEFFIHWLALNALGAAIVPLSGQSTRGELAYAISLCEPVLTVTFADSAQHLLAAINAAGAPVPLATIGAEAALPRAATPAVKQPPAADTECALLFTSGSTGEPKGCILSNAYFTLFGEWYAALGGFCDLGHGTERLLTPLPLTHMNALACSTMGMIQTGGCIIQLDRFHPSTWWQTVCDSGATAIHYLGVMPAILLELDQDSAEREHRVRFGFGAGCNPRHQAAFEQRFGFPLIEGWAMTETGSGGCIMANVEPRHVGARCFGKPTAAVETRVVDNADQEVLPGEPGELLVRAAGDEPKRGFFAGYHRDAAASEKVWRGGWLHTGDIVRTGEDGSFYFIDRKKAIIRRSGENISAAEVEGALAGLAGVRQAAVAPVPDDTREEEVMACLMIDGDRLPDEATAREIFELLRTELSYFKLPGYIAFVDDLPLTASQKIQRGALKPLCLNLLANNQAFDLRHLKSSRPAKRARG